MTERTHAFLAARYYEYLTRQFGQQGKAAFVHATRHYAEQRGRRMARRALRDGEELNWTSYYRYGEWVSSPECIAEGTSNQHSFIRYEPEGVLKITRCPWKAQFAEMGVDGTAGALYCSVLDDSIARGFNPGLRYDIDQTMETEEYCIHRLQNLDFTPETDLSKRPGVTKDFDYHCGHLYWAFRTVAEAVFGAEGRALAEQVLRDVRERYGEDTEAKLKEYEDTDFEMI